MTRREATDAVWLLAFSIALKATFLLLGILFWETSYVQSIVGDIRTWFRFWEACRDGGVPYVDITKEYAAAVGLLYWVMTPVVSLADGNGPLTLLLHGIMASVMDVVNTLILYCILRELNARLALPFAVLFVLLPTNLVLSPERFESYVTFTVLLGHWCHRRGRPALAAFFWSLGCWLKWYPAFFIAAQELRALLIERRRWHWLKATGVFVGVSVALNLPFILANLVVHGNIDNWLYPYRFHAERGISGDTILGVAQLWLGELRWSDYSAIWTLGLLFAALVVKPTLRIEYRCMLVCLAMLVLNRIYSTQFNLWFYPFLILAAAQETSSRRRGLLAVLVVLDVLNVLVYPFSYVWTLREVGSFAPLAAANSGGIGTVIFSAAVIIRGILLVVLAGFALTERRCEESAAAADSAEGKRKRRRVAAIQEGVVGEA
jgi:hypothetical protein